MNTRTISTCIVFGMLAVSWGLIAPELVSGPPASLIITGIGGAMLGLIMLLVINRIKNKETENKG